MAQNAALKIPKFSGGGPPDTPHLPRLEPPSLVPAIDTFAPATSNLNKNPDISFDVSDLKIDQNDVDWQPFSHPQLMNNTCL